MEELFGNDRKRDYSVDAWIEERMVDGKIIKLETFCLDEEDEEGDILCDNEELINRIVGGKVIDLENFCLICDDEDTETIPDDGEIINGVVGGKIIKLENFCLEKEDEEVETIPDDGEMINGVVGGKMIKLENFCLEKEDEEVETIPDDGEMINGVMGGKKIKLDTFRWKKEDEEVETIPDDGEMMNDAAQLNIMDLADEIVLHIFSFLPLHDRKIVRQVCKQWHRLSYTHFLAKRDVTVVEKYRNLLDSFTPYSRYVNVDIIIKESDIIRSTDIEKSKRFWSYHGCNVMSLHIRCAINCFKFSCELVSNCPNLEHLTLVMDIDPKSELVTDLCLPNITFPRLVSLKLRGHPHLIFPLLQAATKNCPILDSITLQCGFLQSENLERKPLNLEFVQATKLKNFTVSYTAIDNEFVDVMTQVLGPKLKRLSVIRCTGMTDSFGKFFARKCNNIEELIYWGSPLENVFENVLAYFKNLTSISLFGLSFLTDAKVAFLSVLPNLAHLDLTACHNLTDVGISNVLGTFVRPKLTELHLSSLPDITDALIANIAPKLPNLKFLNLSSSTSLTHSSLETVIKYNPLLQCLLLQGCKRVYRVSFGQKSINDLKNLIYLDLIGTGLTESSVSEISLPNLKVLDSNVVDTDRMILLVIKQCPSLIDYECYDFGLVLLGADGNRRTSVRRKMSFFKWWTPHLWRCHCGINVSYIPFEDFKF